MAWGIQGGKRVIACQYFGKMPLAGHARGCGPLKRSFFILNLQGHPLKTATFVNTASSFIGPTNSPRPMQIVQRKLWIREKIGSFKKLLKENTGYSHQVILVYITLTLLWL